MLRSGAKRGLALGRIGALASLAAVLAAGGPGGTRAATKEDRAFTVGNYPVEARAADAVAAKERAIADAQQAAFRSLLKRIVPVTSYKRLEKLRTVNAAELIEGLAVRSERNSATEYIATYDFTFQAEAVRRILDREGIPFLDRQAPQVTLVPVYRAPAEPGSPEIYSDARGSDAWLYAWKGLDVTNSLTPVNLQALKKSVHADTIRAIVEGDAGAVRTMAGEYGSDALLIAYFEPDLGQKRVRVVLAGRDAVAPFVLHRTYRLDGPDLAYTAELAAVLALGVLEGRWKAINVRGSGGGDGAVRSAPVSIRPAPGPDGAAATGPAATAGSAALEPDADGLMRIAVEFRNIGEWQQISRQLSSTPDVSDIDVLGLSGRSARITLRYGGHPQELALALAQQGLILRTGGGGWMLSQK